MVQNYIYSNVIGAYVLDSTNRIVESIEYKKSELDVASSLLSDSKVTPFEKKLLKKYPDALLVNPKIKKQGFTVLNDNDKILKIVSVVNTSKTKSSMIKNNKVITSEEMRNAVNTDNLVVQTIAAIEESDKIVNLLVKRLREWYSIYFPELDKNISDHRRFAELVIKDDVDSYLKKWGIDKSIGANLDYKDSVLNHAQRTLSMIDYRDELVQKLEKIMKANYKNLYSEAGALIGARILAAAGSLRRLAVMTSSTIQLLGAEKALFRHLTSGARVPKHGLIVNHPDIASKGRKERGKAARVLANKISIAARRDYWGGKDE